MSFFNLPQIPILGLPWSYTMLGMYVLSYVCPFSWFTGSYSPLCDRLSLFLRMTCFLTLCYFLWRVFFLAFERDCLFVFTLRRNLYLFVLLRWALVSLAVFIPLFCWRSRRSGCRLLRFVLRGLSSPDVLCLVPFPQLIFLALSLSLHRFLYPLLSVILSTALDYIPLFAS